MLNNSEIKDNQGQMRHVRETDFSSLFWICGMCIVIKPCYVACNLLRTTSPPCGELQKKRTRPEAILGTSSKMKTFIHLHVDWSTAALDPLNSSANHVARSIWDTQQHQALRMTQCPVSAFWYRSGKKPLLHPLIYKQHFSSDLQPCF